MASKPYTFRITLKDLLTRNINKKVADAQERSKEEQSKAVAEVQELAKADRLVEGSVTTPGVKPLRVAGARHGWTQFPDFALDQRQLEQKYDVFDRSIAFLQRVWAQCN